ncbi:hypothetical protein D3Z58_04280 [Clostridiaceae bacterium]|nr:hypothetical protein [Clostridiaceae bacterium]
MKIKINGEGMIAAAMYLLVFYLCLPFSMILLNSMMIRLIMLISTCLLFGGMIVLKKEKQIFSLSILFLFMFLYWQITWRSQLDKISYVYYCFVSLAFVFGGMILYYGKNESLLRHLFLFITIIYFITALTSIAGLNVYPLAARELARGSTYDTSLDFTTYKEIYRKMNIVSWSQAYGMLFGIPVSLMIWKKKKKAFYIVLLAALFLMMIQSQITFAVLLAIVLIVASIMCSESKTKTIFITMFFSIIAIVVLMNLEEVLTMAVCLAEEAGFEFLTTKLNDMKILLVYRDAVGDASARGMLYQTSIETFLGNPFFGLMDSGRASLDQIGYHSELFDFVGTFGLFGLFVIFASFVGYFSFLKKTGLESRKDLGIIFVGFIGAFIFNPVFNSPQVFAGAFLYPLLACRYCSIRGREEQGKVMRKRKVRL